MGLNRQRALANMLLQQNMQAPQGQMVSGRYVAPNPLQYLGNMAQIVSANQMASSADKEQLALAQKLKTLEGVESGNILKALQGTPEKVYEQQSGPMLDGSNIPQQIDAAIPGSTEAAYAAALRGQTPAAKSFVPILQKQLTQEPIWEKTTIKQNGQEIQGVYDKRNPNVMSTFRPYNASTDIPLATAQYSGIVPQGMGNTPVALQSNQTSPFVSQAQSLGLPVISGVRNELQQAELRHHRDPATGQWMTKENRPVAENSAHFYGNAIDLKPNAPLNANQQTWLNQNAYRPNPTKDANHWEAKPNASQMPAAGQTPTVGQQSTKYDLPVPAFRSQKQSDEWVAKSQEPLTGEAAKKADGAVTTLNALDNYKKLIDNYSKSQILMPDDRTKLSEAHSQLMLQLKDANGLGVLNKGDLPMLEKLIVNPTNIETLLLSKNVLESQIGNQKSFMRDVAANSYLNNYKEIPPRIKQTLINVDSDLEKINSQKDVAKTANLQKPINYNSQSAAQAAGKSGKLQDGQKIIIGGNVYTWKND
jgi:hypothetical protein